MFDGFREGPYAAVAVVAVIDCLLHAVCLVRAEGNIMIKQNTTIVRALHSPLTRFAPSYNLRPRSTLNTNVMPGFTAVTLPSCLSCVHVCTLLYYCG